jgi:4-phosphopantoate--beta-alanine ligase
MVPADIPASHPRYKSLQTRAHLARLAEEGVVAREGLIAHGRGEAFDYLLGERTQPFAEEAARAAACALLLARKPVLCVNGNVAALAAPEMVALAKALPATLEVNVFHRTEARVAKLAGLLRAAGAERVVGEQPDARIPGLDHARAVSSVAGSYGADVVLVPLEDGDRAQALRGMGKAVLVVDLNPLSRTARSATVSVTDNVRRAVPNVTRHARALDAATARDVVARWDAARNLRETLDFVAARLRAL